MSNLKIHREIESGVLINCPKFQITRTIVKEVLQSSIFSDEKVCFFNHATFTYLKSAKCVHHPQQTYET